MPETGNRRVTHNTPGEAHELTFSCYKRLPLLVSDHVCRTFLRVLGESRDKFDFEVWAYVLMPEHVHILINPRHGDYDVDLIRRDLKQRSAFASLAWMRNYSPEVVRKLDTVEGSLRRTRFWQDGRGYDRNLFKPESVWASIEYIHENPVRRGLCESSVDWPWSSARNHLGIEPVEFEIDACSAPQPRRKLY